MTDKGPILKALEKSLAAAATHDLDAAGVQLAREYADLIDGAAGDPETDQAVMSDIGPKFHKLLNDLGLLPAGRAAMQKGGTGNVSTGSGKLDELRARRAARAHGAAPVDTTSA